MTEEEVDLLTKKLPDRLLGKRTAIIDDCLFLEAGSPFQYIQMWIMSGHLVKEKQYKVYIGNVLEAKVIYHGVEHGQDGKINYNYDIQPMQPLEYIEIKLNLK